MRSEVLRAWRDEVVRCMSGRLPHFTLSTRRARPDPPGLLKFEWQAGHKLWCFIAFRPLDSEAFEAYAGWSTDYSKSAVTNVAVSSGSIDDFSSKFHFDFSMSYVPRSGLSYWNFWNPSGDAVDDARLFANEYLVQFARVLSADEAQALVAPAVKEAMDEIVTYCIPHLEKRVSCG